MYEILSNERIVKKETVETWKREIYNCNIVEVEAGTTGYCGGDTGHGGRTYIRIKDLGSTDMQVQVKDYNEDNTEEVTICLGGDAELETTIESLEFILQVLKDQAGKN